MLRPGKRTGRATAVTPQPLAEAPPFTGSEVVDGQRIFAFNASLAVIFLRFSMLHMLVSYTTGKNLYLLYLVSLPAFLGLFLARGIARSFYASPTKYWLGFAIWMAIATPLSTWRGASAELFYDYLRTDLPMLFIGAGLILTWKECKKVAWVIAFGAVANLATARFYQRTVGADRLEVQFGIVGNANDFAGHLLLVLPFLLWIGTTAKTVWRVLALGLVAYGLVLILRTGSRGALVGLIIEVLFFMVRGTSRQKITLLVIGPIAAIMLLAVLPQDVRSRLVSFAPGEGVDNSAIESQMGRQRVLMLSLRYTVEHALFGVGPGQFSNYEGNHDFLSGRDRGAFLDTHNSYTQVSSECGVPGMFFYFAGTIATFLLLNKTYKQALARPDCQDITKLLFYIMLGFTGFSAAVAFLNFGYFFYQPFFGGFSIALARAAREEFRVRSLAATAAPAPGPAAYPPGLPKPMGARRLQPGGPGERRGEFTPRYS